MRAPDLPIASFFDTYHDAIVAVVTVALAFVLAEIVDRALLRRAVASGNLSPRTDTRLRLVRRLLFVAILLVGLAIALSQFSAVKRVATGVLASSAVLGLVLGFAARQTLANGIAGVLLAITQPIRIGDVVTFEGETGTVEDVRLTYTFLRTGDGERIVIPNERLAQSPIENHTITDPRVRVVASIWLTPEADAVRALAVLSEETDWEVEIAEIDKEGVRLDASTWADSPAERGATAARIRATCLERLRSEGLSSPVGGN
jgi:small-conductance mechanosensitive channel